MTSFSPKIAIVEGNSRGVWAASKEFFDGYFNYEPVRYRVIGREDNKIHLREERAETRYWLKVLTLATIVFPAIAAICWVVKKVWQGSYEVVLNGEKEVSKVSKVIKPEVEVKREKGVAPSYQKAVEFLRHPSIAPGCSVKYRTAEGDTEILYLGVCKEEFCDESKIFDPNRNILQLDNDLEIPLESKGDLTGELVPYLEDFEMIEGKLWKEYRPYREALKVLLLEHPDDRLYYMKALKNGKIVYLSIEDEDLNGRSRIVCRDQPLSHTYPYWSETMDNQWPYFDHEGETVVSNFHLAVGLLSNQNEEDTGKYVTWISLNPRTGKYEKTYYWNEIVTSRRNENIELKLSRYKPEGREPYQFSLNQVKQALQGKSLFIN